jgi:hypothetical protein
MEGRLDAVEAELQRLRDWRHDVASPRLLAMESQLKVTAEILQDTAETVAAMRREDEFNSRLAAALAKRKFAMFSTTEKVVVALFAAIPAVNLALRLAGYG